ncbi:MAG: OmpA family protein [Roseibium sp.]
MPALLFLIWLLAAAQVALAQDDVPIDALALQFIEKHRKQVEVSQETDLIASVYQAGSVLFLDGGTEINSAGKSTLDALAKALDSDEMKGVGVMVASYASSDGNAERNETISQKRADAVMEYLQSVGGISSDRLSGKGFGETAPLIRLDPDDPQQRRVDLLLIHVPPPQVEAEKLARPSGLKLTPFGAGLEPIETTILVDTLFQQPDGPAIPLEQFGTIEFWVMPTQGPNNLSEGDDPVLLAINAVAGTKLTIQMSADQDELIVWNGEGQDGLASVPYAFEDGVSRHIALATLNGRSSLYIDGKHRGTFDVGYGPGSAFIVNVGALNSQNELAFEGQIGGLRLWRRALGPEVISDLPTTSGDPTPASPLYDDLLAYLADGDRYLSQLVPAIVLETEAWTLFGSQSVSIQNKSNYAASAVFSQSPEDRAKSDLASHDPELRSDHIDLLKRYVKDPGRVFTSHPLFTIQQRGADHEDLLLFPVPPSFGNEALLQIPVLRSSTLQGKTIAPARARLSRLSFVQDQTGIKGVRVDYHDAGLGRSRLDFEGATVGGVSQASPEQLLAENDQITGLSGFAEPESGRIVSLTVHGTIGEIGRFGPVDPDGLELDAFSQFLPAGTPLSGLRFVSDEQGYLIGVGLVGDHDASRPTITVTLEDGQAEHFLRVDRNRFQSIASHSILTGTQAPMLKIIAPDLIEVDGLPIDLVPVHPHPLPKGETSSFDNVFIVQAKAVNLQANYQGYDITEMDPIHLTDNGTNRSVFALPDPTSNDYYDANRVFVPSGLLYVPEFTGQQHSKTHVITSMNEFQSAAAHNVSAEGSIGPASFSRSENHQRTSQTLRQRNHTMTLGLSKAIFYDLVLDKARMRLDRQFVSRINRLKARGADADYDRFVATFGTHYPYAVIYGGMGVLQMEYSANKIAQLRGSQVEIGYSAQASLTRKVTPSSGNGPAQTQQLGSGNFSNSRSQAATARFEQEMSDQLDNFYFVGGAHAGVSKESWGVGVDGVVPVHVSLRTLDELLVAPFFDDPVVTYDIKPKLKAAIDRRIAAAAAAAGSGNGRVPRLVELKLVKFSPNKWTNRDELEEGEYERSGGPDNSDVRLLEIGGEITVGSNLANETKSQQTRLFFDVEQPPAFSGQSGISNVDVSGFLPRDYFVKEIDTDNGALSHVFGVDPCVIELGGTFEVDIDLYEYDVSRSPDAMKKAQEFAWSDALKSGELTLRIAGSRPRLERFGCAPKDGSIQCYDFDVEFEVVELATTFATPAANPACPATLEALNALAETTVTGGQ